MRRDVDSDYLLALELYSINSGPVLLLYFNMSQFGKRLGRRVVKRAGKAKNTVAGTTRLEYLGEVMNNTLASVSGRTDDKNSGSHSGFIDTMTEGVLKIKCPDCILYSREK